MTAVAVSNIIIAIGIYFTVFSIDNKMIIDSLKHRADAVYGSINKRALSSSFISLNQRNDEKTKLYQDTLNKLNQMRKIANIRYLYTAKKSGNKYVYLVDGYSAGESDFRHVGDAIEPEIIPQMKYAMDKQKPVYAKELLNSDWGVVYVVYYPYINDGKVLGVIGMEFNTDAIFEGYNKTKYYSYAITILLFLLILAITTYYLNKVSNPFIYNLAYNDLITSLENRNSFEGYLRTLRKENTLPPNSYIVMLDLNNLKIVNDKLGHKVGDRYLQILAALMKKHFPPAECRLFRIGGDEFAIITQRAFEEELAKDLKQISADKSYSNDTSDKVPFSFAYGYHSLSIDTLSEDISKADKRMYKHKILMKQYGYDG